jgi:hypothetical protein
MTKIIGRYGENIADLGDSAQSMKLTSLWPLLWLSKHGGRCDHLSQIPRSMDDVFCWCMSFKLGAIIIGSLDTTLLWLKEIGWIHEVICETPWHGLEMSWHQGGYLIGSDDTEALLGQYGYMEALAKPRWHGSPMNRHPRGYSVGNGRYTSHTRS